MISPLEIIMKCEYILYVKRRKFDFNHNIPLFRVLCFPRPGPIGFMH